MNTPRFIPQCVWVSRSSLAILMSAACALGGYSANSTAQPAAALEEVIVTARKRTESLQNTPVAVSSFSADTLRTEGIANLSELVKYVPGVSNRDLSKFSGLAIRGVGSRIPDPRTDPGVGVYVDNIFIPRSDTQLLEVIDVESIQVLRGPQGTLFGKNTAGGAVLMTTVKPQEEFSGFVNVKLGDYDRNDFRARVSGPLGNGKLLGSILAQSRSEDGYMEDAVTGTDFGNIDRNAVVGQLRWLPAENLTVDMLAFWSEQDENTHPVACRVVYTGAQIGGIRAPGHSQPIADLCEASAALEDQDKVTLDSNHATWENNNTMLGLTVNWDVSQDLTLRSITGYLQQDDINQSFDSEGTSAFAFANKNALRAHFDNSGVNLPAQEREFISQEFNLLGSALDGRLRYTAGVFGSIEEIDHVLEGTSLTPSGYIGVPIAPPIRFVPNPSMAGFNAVRVSDFKNESLAGFTQLIYDLTDDVQLTVGGRYTWEKKTIDVTRYASSIGPLGVVPTAVFDALEGAFQSVIVNPNPALANYADKNTWTDFTGMASISWTLPESMLEGSALDSAMIYLSYAEGFKAGGFSVFFNQSTPFDPENLASYEFGFKLDMLDKRMRLNGSLFTSSYDDMQLFVTRLNTTAGEIVPTVGFGISNAAKAEVTGVELEWSVLPFDGMYIALSGGYIDAGFDEFDDPSVVNGVVVINDRSDDDFTFIPKLTYSLLAQYTWQTDIGAITPSISGFYKDDVYLGLDHVASSFDGSYVDSFTLWNARLAFQPASMENLNVAAWVNNLADNNYYASGLGEIGTQGVVGLTVGKPRTYGVEIYYSW